VLLFAAALLALALSPLLLLQQARGMSWKLACKAAP